MPHPLISPKIKARLWKTYSDVIYFYSRGGLISALQMVKLELIKQLDELEQKPQDYPSSIYYSKAYISDLLETLENLSILINKNSNNLIELTQIRKLDISKIHPKQYQSMLHNANLDCGEFKELLQQWTKDLKAKIQDEVYEIKFHEETKLHPSALENQKPLPTNEAPKKLSAYNVNRLKLQLETVHENPYQTLSTEIYKRITYFIKLNCQEARDFFKLYTKKAFKTNAKNPENEVSIYIQAAKEYLNKKKLQGHFLFGSHIYQPFHDFLKNIAQLNLENFRLEDETCEEAFGTLGL